MTTPLNRNQQVPQQTPLADTTSKKTEGSADTTNLSSVKTIKESMENVTEKKDLSGKNITKNSHDSEILSKTKDMSPVKNSPTTITTPEEELKAQEKLIAALKKEVGEKEDPFKYEEDRKEERAKEKEVKQKSINLERLAKLEKAQLELDKEIAEINNRNTKTETKNEKGAEEKTLSPKEKLIKDQQEEIERFKKGLGSKEENQPTSDKKNLISENEAVIEKLKKEIASKEKSSPPIKEEILSPKEKALKEQQAEIEQFRKTYGTEGEKLNPKQQLFRDQLQEINELKRKKDEAETPNRKDISRKKQEEIENIKKQLSDNEKLQAEKVAAKLAEGQKELERLNEAKRLKELNKQETEPKAQKTEVKIQNPPSKKEDDGCVIS